MGVIRRPMTLWVSADQLAVLMKSDEMYGKERSLADAILSAFSMGVDMVKLDFDLGGALGKHDEERNGISLKARFGIIEAGMRSTFENGKTMEFPE